MPAKCTVFETNLFCLPQTAALFLHFLQVSLAESDGLWIYLQHLQVSSNDSVVRLVIGLRELFKLDAELAPYVYPEIIDRP
jgi:hypothetical protein